VTVEVGAGSGEEDLVAEGRLLERVGARSLVWEAKMVSSRR